MDCAVIPINRSDNSFESVISVIVRTYEIFYPDVFYIMYEPFNLPVLRKLEEFLNSLDRKVEKVDLSQYESVEGENTIWKFIKVVEEKTKECRKVYLIPTVGANVLATALGLLYTKDTNRYNIVTYHFSFGPWTPFHYPFTPRETERVEVEPTAPLVMVEDQIKRLSKLDTYFHKVISSQLNVYLKDMYELTYSLNKNVGAMAGIEVVYDKKKEEFLLEELDKKGIKEWKEKLNEILEDEEVNNVLDLSGIYEITVEDGRRLQDVVTEYPSVVIDTNLIYYGIHSLEIKNLTIPYCVEFEVESKFLTRKSPFYNVLYSVFDALSERARIIPSMGFFCDHAIPRIDPILLEDALVLTSDKRAYEMWKNSPLSKYATVMLTKIERNRIKERKHERMFSLLNIAVMLKEILNAEVKPITK